MRWTLLILAAGLGPSALIWRLSGGQTFVLLLPLLFLPFAFGRRR